MILRWQDADPSALAGAAVAVIDVLRWSTSVITALAHGATKVCAAETPEVARALAAGLVPPPLLAGERNSLRIPGFDLGNSPGEFAAGVVGGREIVTTTTNGTQALRAARTASIAVVAAFVNLGAAAEALAAAGAPVVLLCAGQAGAEAIEDSCCAGALLEALGTQPDGESAERALALWREQGRDAARAVTAAPHGQSLIRAGFAVDLLAAASVDRWRLTPRLGAELALAD